MEEAVERAAIARAVQAIRSACGVAPVGWHTKSSASVNTRRLLVEHGGFLYDSDAYNDELPFYVDVGGRALGAGQMAVISEGAMPSLHARTRSIVLVIGGEPVGPRFIDWNFVSSSKERIEW